MSTLFLLRSLLLTPIYLVDATAHAMGGQQQFIKLGKALASKQPRTAQISKLDPISGNAVSPAAASPYDYKPQFRTKYRPDPPRRRLTEAQLNRRYVYSSFWFLFQEDRLAHDCWDLRLIGIMAGLPIAIVTGYTLYLRGEPMEWTVDSS